MRKAFAYLLSAAVLSLAVPGAVALAEGVLRINDVAVGELDPHKGKDYADSMLMFNIYDFLVRPKEGGGGVVPDLATEWSSSADGLTYTFKLRTDAKFHDGSPVEASDVVFSANRMLTMKLGFAFLFDRIKEVAALDKHTVQFTLKEVYAPFIASMVRLAVLNEDLVMANKKPGDFGDFGDYGDAFINTKDAGSGAYYVESHNPQEITVMRKFDRHHLGHAAKAPDVVRLRYSLETATVRALMVRKEHEITRQQMPSEVYAKLAEEDGISLAQDRQAAAFYLKLNTKRPPTDDVHFRRAMAHAFDYETLQRVITIAPGIKSGSPARGPLPRGMMGYDESIPFPKRDLKAARAELALSKYKADQYAVDVLWIPEAPLEEKFSLLFQQNMSEVGIKVNIVKAPWALLTEMAQKVETTPHVNNVYVSAVTPDADSLLWTMYHSSAAGSWSSMEWLQDPEIDRLLEEGRSILDPAKREAHYKLLNRKIIEMQPDIFGYDRSLVVSKQDYVSAPALEDPAHASAVSGHNYIFRNYQIMN